MSKEIIAIFQWEDGTTKEVTCTNVPGIRHNGDRPSKVYYSPDLKPDDIVMLYCTLKLSASSKDVETWYQPSSKYLPTHGELVELHEHAITKELYIPINEHKTVLYNKAYDGKFLSKEEAAEQFPEYFI